MFSLTSENFDGSNLKVDLAVISEENNRLRARNTALSEQLNELEDDYAALQMENSILIDRVSKQSEEMNHMQKLMVNSIEQAEYDRVYKDWETMVERWSRSVATEKESKNELNAKKKELETLIVLVDKLENENERQRVEKEKLKQNDQSCNSLLEQLATMQLVMENYQEKLISSEEIIEELKQTVDYYQNQLKSNQLNDQQSLYSSTSINLQYLNIDTEIHSTENVTIVDTTITDLECAIKQKEQELAKVNNDNQKLRTEIHHLLKLLSNKNNNRKRRCKIRKQKPKFLMKFCCFAVFD